MPTALPNWTTGVSKAEGEAILQALIRTLGSVSVHVAREEILAPGPEDEAGCELFARGYLLGAGLDPKWRDDAEAWKLVGWAALLAGGAAQLPADVVAQVGSMEPLLAQAREDMPYFIAEASERFARGKPGAAEAKPKAKPKAKTRVGRNDPCPCGSGKKYKKCCGAA